MRLALANLIHWVFLVYTLFLIVRIIGSWFPNLARHRWMHFVAFYTDPYLNLFRKWIPPLGGVLDLSPILGFFALQILEQILLYIIL